MEDYAQQMGWVLHILSSAVQSGWEFYRLFEYECIFIYIYEISIENILNPLILKICQIFHPGIISG